MYILKWVLLLLLKYIFSEKTVLLLRYCGRLSSRYFILMKYKLKMLQFIPNAPSTCLWAMNDAHSQMIHSYESILFKGFIKPVGKPVNRFANQFEWFVQFPAARAESSEAVHSDNIKSDEDVALDLQSSEANLQRLVC